MFSGRGGPLAGLRGGGGGARWRPEQPGGGGGASPRPRQETSAFCRGHTGTQTRRPGRNAAEPAADEAPGQYVLRRPAGFFVRKMK